eukprot:INCI5719.1.p1 GENE.INCI5719.1~~INCI5719.1.p1  ORF type:complete len:325 (-),score=54.65 INCI5719.1:123-1097(-)
MAKGGGKTTNEDWACCEQCSYCFTLFVGVLFFLAGGAMAVYSALFLFSGIDVSIAGLELINVDALQWGIFIVGICIAGTALLGMISAGCAKCAANPDGKNDCCERCCTAILSLLYIVILSVLLAATLVIAGGLSYYAVILSDATSSSGCPYADSSTDFVAANVPDAASCPLDNILHLALYPPGGSPTEDTLAATWRLAQDATATCGYYCEASNPNYCSPSLGSAYAAQTTGLYCDHPVNITQPEATVYQGSNNNGTAQEYRFGEVSTMPYRPTFYSVLNQFLVPFLAVWWCIFVFAILLIVAACVMCIRKKKTTKESTYKPGSN